MKESDETKKEDDMSMVKTKWENDEFLMDEDEELEQEQQILEKVFEGEEYDGEFVDEEEFVDEDEEYVRQTQTKFDDEENYEEDYDNNDYEDEE